MAFHPIILLPFLPIWAACYWIIPYFTIYKHLKHIPGPFVAKFSNVWLALGLRKGKKYLWVHDAHRKYGKVVRVGFNHVSIATPEGLRDVYADGNGVVKDIFYDAFGFGVPDLFSTRDMDEHARKRKLVSHCFSPEAIRDFEPYISVHLKRWARKLDRITKATDDGGYTCVNIKPWLTFLAFDIASDLAYGGDSGMVQRGRDQCELAKKLKIPRYVTGVELLDRRGGLCGVLGLLPALRPWRWLLPDPFFRRGLQANNDIRDLGVAAMARRFELWGDDEPPRPDMLNILRRRKDAKGKNMMPRDEILSETLALFIGGSDDLSSAVCGIVYWILEGERRRPGTIISRLQAELDVAIQQNPVIAKHSEVKNLPFLRRCIHEGMRLHSPSAIGLPRIVTGPNGMNCENEHFPGGTVLSVPSYTLHHSEEIWGADVEEFNPDRWLDATPQQKMAFKPFSHGPRDCIGQDLAYMEMELIIGTAFHRYDIKSYQEQIKCHAGVTMKLSECWVGMKLRFKKTVY